MMVPRWIIAIAAATEACSWGCQQSPLTPADSALIGAETDEQAQCVIDNRGDGGAIDQCRMRVRSFYSHVWASKLGDGGLTP